MINKNREQLLERLLHQIAARAFNHRSLRPELRKREAAPNCYVDDRKATVGSIHGPKYVKIIGKVQAILPVILVYLAVGVAIVPLYARLTRAKPDSGQAIALEAK